MLDRESTFAVPETVDLLKTKFIPVAIDQAYERRQKDTEGEFYRKIASQSPRNNFNATTQGFYVATPAGKLLFYNNNRDPQKLLRLLKGSLSDWKALLREQPQTEKPIDASAVDPRFGVTPPEGGLVLRARAKVLGGYEDTSDRWRAIFQNAVSRDNMWISEAEHRELVQGRVPSTLEERMARFHLVDNTRGEPPMWRSNEIESMDLSIDDGTISGTAKLKSSDGSRGYDAQLLGEIEVQQGRVVRLDLVALADFWGEGRFTRGAPKGKFPLAIAFELADGSDTADAIPPQGSRGWLQGYLQLRR